MRTKKWRKKLDVRSLGGASIGCSSCCPIAQKEERSHDDRIAAANAKLKEAGEVFEKRSKKNPQGAAEEHTRYINLLTTLGPEINQEKQ